VCDLGDVSSSLTVACPKIVQDYDTCQDLFGAYYTNNSRCIEAVEELVPLVNMATNPYYMFCYVWISVITVSVMLWCYYNEVLCPRTDVSSRPLQVVAENKLVLTQSDTKCTDPVVIASTIVSGTTKDGGTKLNRSSGPDETSAEEESSGDAQMEVIVTEVEPVSPSPPPSPNVDKCASSGWTQMGYRYHWLGTILYYAVILTMLGIQFLLLSLTIFYYMQQGEITRFGENNAPIKDEEQVLQTFVIVWMTGLPFTLAFRYPANGIQSLFLRKCAIDKASHIAVVSPNRHNTTASASQPAAAGACSGAKVVSSSPYLQLVSAYIWLPFDVTLRTVFSYYHDRDGTTTTKLCPVTTDPTTGTKGFYHNMRRYVSPKQLSSEDAGDYVPGYFSVGSTIADFLQQTSGLRTSDVEERMGLVGPNVISMKKPTVLKSLYKEFNKAFYVYQNFMVCTSDLKDRALDARRQRRFHEGNPSHILTIFLRRQTNRSGVGHLTTTTTWPLSTQLFDCLVAALQLFSSTKPMSLCIKYLKCLELLSTFCVLRDAVLCLPAKRQANIRGFWGKP
jgi:Cation transporter/ATPase, N-terminus